MIRLSAAVVSFALLGAACGGSVAQPEPSTSSTAAEATRAPVAVQSHGMVHAMGEALGQVALRPDQRAQIEKLAADSDAQHAQAIQARHDLMTALAAQVQAGAVDRAALQPKIDAANAAARATRTQDFAALEELHTILDPQQRTDFVNAMEAAHGQGGGHHGPGPGAGGPRDGMRAWAKDLNLTDDQQQQIHAAMQARFAQHEGRQGDGEMQHHGGPNGPNHVLEAFRGDHFVMAELVPAGGAGGGPGPGGHGMEDHLLGMAEVVVPILTPEQRTIVAQKLTQWGTHAEGDEPPPAPPAQ